MSQSNETRRAGGAAGLGNSSSVTADRSENIHSQATAALQRDFIAEALRVASIKAAHAAEDVLLGDDVGAEREIRQAISHLRAGSATFREMQGAFEGSAASRRPEAVL
jgi:mevalonate pyrophosphate decarboxylase